MAKSTQNKDRETLLPETRINPLKKHLGNVKKIYESDQHGKIHGVYLPDVIIGLLQRMDKAIGKAYSTCELKQVSYV